MCVYCCVLCPDASACHDGILLLSAVVLASHVHVSRSVEGRELLVVKLSGQGKRDKVEVKVKTKSRKVMATAVCVCHACLFVSAGCYGVSR